MIRATTMTICLSVVLLAGCNSASSPDQSTSSTVPAEESPAAANDSESTPTKMEQVEIGENEHQAANADVIQVRAVLDEDGTWTFHVTVSHPDTGWDDYADGWDVVTEAGEVIKASSADSFTRLLLHPHENEQPFTRSQSNIAVPDGETALTVRAHDIVDGFGGVEMLVDLSAESGPGYVIERN